LYSGSLKSEIINNADVDVSHILNIVTGGEGAV